MTPPPTSARNYDFLKQAPIPSLTSGHAGEQHEAHPGQGGGGGGQDVTQAVGGVVHIFTEYQNSGKA